MVEGAVAATVAAAPPPIDQVVTCEHEQAGAGIQVARIAPRTGVIVCLLDALIHGRIDGHAPMVGAHGDPGATALAC